ncbi:ATP-binding protein, partial [bacterium]|nr:ATP-binding protein [bacterium]
MSDGESFIKISRKDVREKIKDVSDYFLNVSWTSPIAGEEEKERPVSGFRAPSVKIPEGRTISIEALAREICGTPVLLPPAANNALVAIRDGMCIGLHIAGLYAAHDNLEQLYRLNSEGPLQEPTLTEFREKKKTSAAIFAFVAASYVLWTLAETADKEAKPEEVNFKGIPEFNLDSPARAIRCLLFHFGEYLERGRGTYSEHDIGTLARVYFRMVFDEVKLREPGLKYAESFVSNRYKLEDTDFFVEGWKEVRSVHVEAVEYKRRLFTEIVGNMQAKRDAWMLVFQLCSYCVKEQRNPCLDHGGMATVRLLYGDPGGGKTMQVEATVTLLTDVCKEIGLPYLIHPIPKTLVSEFQGVSARVAADY